MSLALVSCGDNDPHTLQENDNRATEHSEPATQRAGSEGKSVTDSGPPGTPVPSSAQHVIPAETQEHVRLIPETNPAQIKLEIPPAHFESQHEQEIDLLHQPAAQRLAPQKKRVKKLELGGGIITDPEAADLKESVDGAEIKLDLKWD
jgi:hypothetical protein